MTDNSRAVPWLQWEGDIEEDTHLDDSNGGQDFDPQLIQAIKLKTNLFRLITSSFCPQIYGQMMVKSALVLSLFGGVDKVNPQCSGITTRGQIHVLLFGDHGSNKDLLLKAVHSMAPKAKYLCGNTATTDTLTPCLKKRKINKGFEDHFSKGSLISEKFAVCCFDEFERMNGSQHNVIQEVMETQTLSIYKSAKYREMAAKTSIIAAINPINGCYDWSLNVWQNTKLNKTLISKFDLIFNLIDSPNEELDSKLSKDILDSRKIQSNEHNLSQKRGFCSQTLNSDPNDCKLMSKLVYKPEDEEPDLIPHKLLQQYVKYAQQHCHPILTSEAKALLNQFCSEIAKSEICKSKTKRLETLYRLTEARARVELKQSVTEEDANDVIDIVRHSIGKHYFAPNYVQQMKGFQKFSKRSKKQNQNHLYKALQIFSEQNKENVFSFEQIQEISQSFEIPFDTKEDILRAIDCLNNDSLLLKIGSNYKLL